LGAFYSGIIPWLAMPLVLNISHPAYAGIPVADGLSLAQNMMAAMEAVAQTLKQIQEYQSLLQQYENMLQNTPWPLHEMDTDD